MHVELQKNPFSVDRVMKFTYHQNHQGPGYIPGTMVLFEEGKTILEEFYRNIRDMLSTPDFDCVLVPQMVEQLCPQHQDDGDMQNMLLFSRFLSNALDEAGLSIFLQRLKKTKAITLECHRNHLLFQLGGPRRGYYKPH